MGCRLPIYLDRLRRGLVNARPVLEPRRVTPVAASLDAQNGFGFLAGLRAMQEAVAIAESLGLGIVSVKHSTHFGMAATYVLKALEAGMIALVFSNASRAMPPWGGRGAARHQPAGGRRARRRRPSRILLDMSPAVAARGKIRRALNAVRAFRPATPSMRTDAPPPTRAALQGVVLPIGGPKGSGLSM